MKLEQPEAIKDLRRHIMIAYGVSNDHEVKKALRDALGALSRAMTPLETTDSEPTLAQLRANLETYR